MQKLLLQFCCLIISTLSLAQNSEAYKHSTIDAINRGDYESALSYIDKVENWHVDYVCNISSAMSFLQYMDSINYKSFSADSLCIYIGKEIQSAGHQYFQTNKFEEALHSYMLQAELYKHHIGIFHPEFATSLHNIGIVYIHLRHYKEAEEYLSIACKLRKNIFGSNNIDYAISLEGLAGVYIETKNYDKAETYLLESLVIQKNNTDITTNLDFANTLNTLGHLYQSTKNYKKAKEFLYEALKIRQEVLGTSNNTYAITLANIGICCHNLNDYKSAEKHLLIALDILRNNNNDDYTASTSNSLGVLYNDLGRYSTAKKYLFEALEMRKCIYGLEHSIYAETLHDISVLYYDNGDYQSAKAYAVQAMKIRKNTLGTSHPDYVTSLQGLAHTYSSLGDYPTAIKYYTEALNIQNTIFGKINRNYASSLNGLGICYFYMENFNIAEQYLLEGLRIRRNILPISHVEHILSLNNLGLFYNAIGNYQEAENYLLEALRIQESSEDVRDIDFSNTLNSLGAFYTSIGDYKIAIKYFSMALKILERTENSFDKIATLNNLGAIYNELQNYSISEKYLLRALDIFKRNEILTPDYTTLLNNIGCLYMDMAIYNEARTYLHEALEFHGQQFGTSNLTCATIRNNLGMLYDIIGEKYDAKIHFAKALDIRKSILGVTHPDYASSLNNIGCYYAFHGNYDVAESYFTDASKISKKYFTHSLNYLTEKQRKLYWETEQSRFNNIYPIYVYKYHFSKPSISTFAYDNELFRKGLLLSSSNIIRQSILESNDSILIEQWNELVGIKQVIMNLEEKDPTSTNLVHYKNQADSLEKIITKSSAIFRETKQQQSITWDSIQQYLSPDEVAIEYFIAPLNEDSTMYCALLLRHDSQYPELIPLCEEKEIVNCLSQNRTNDIYTFDTNSKTIFNLIWDKIASKIHEGETIYFSPAGLLHQIAIENIPYDQTHTMSDVYTMVRLSSTREIAKKDKSIKHHTATIYGGIFYDVDKTSLLAESRNYDTEDMFTYRSISSTLPNRGSVLYLPGTKKEAESIYSLLNSNNITSTLYTASKANEESFKSLSGKHRNILHIGTHGFYWEDSTARKQDYFSQRIQLQMLGDNQLQKPSIDPLTRCGLLFAGSNIALSGHSNDLPEGVQDGILTAKEISLMDLRDADLVVLSACETAKGDITSEGIFGLQRAFKMAGVQTIIMSLWKVNDQATQMLMTEFYTNWISKNQSKREAFKNAQNTVRAKFEEPEYWAGFILLD